MSSSTIKHGVKLTNYQQKIMRKGNFPINIRLNNKSLIGPDNLLLSIRQFNKIQKSINNKTGTDLKLEINQLILLDFYNNKQQQQQQKNQ